MEAMARRRLATSIGLVLGLAAGCSGGELIYEKAGVSPARFDQDHLQCQREADRPSSFGMSRAQRLDEDVLQRCMERRGYRVRRAE
jgi:hypothetical protein